MFRSFRFLPLALVLTASFQLGAASIASAHYVQIEARSECAPTSGGAVIGFVASSWSNVSPGGDNPQVNVLFNGVTVATGAFGSGVYSLSGSLPAPSGSSAGDSVWVSVVAAGTWGDGTAGGQSVSTTVTVSADCVQPGLGRFTGGGHQIRVDNVRVTRGLTIHCDLLLSNNLEINWLGNQFHMTEHMTTVACTDSPEIIQAPPVAPLDTLMGIGTGRYNNVDGFTVRFTLVDAGEPGDNDMMAIYIFETANPGNVILNIPLQLLTGGNLQAHYDQPHK